MWTGECWEIGGGCALNSYPNFSLSKLESHGLTLMVDVQVELEAKEPAHGGVAPLGHSFSTP